MIIKNGNGFAVITRGWNPIQEVWVGDHYVWPDGIKGWLIDDFHRSYDIAYDGNPTLTPSDVTSTMPLNDIKNAFIAGKTQSIGNFAFMRAVNMTSLSIEGSDVTYIGRGAFMSATSLSSVSMTDNVLSIDGNAFDSCSNLSGITLSESLQILGDEAFQASGLRDITIPDTVETIGQGAFRNCTSLTGITIGTGVTSIPMEMLRGCTSLVSITIPSGVTSIGASALRYNTGMTGITMVSSTPPTLGANAFDSTANCPIFVPCDAVNTYKTATNWSTYASRIQGYGCEPKATLTLTGGTTVLIPLNGSNTLTSGEVRTSVSDITDITKIEVDGLRVWSLGEGVFSGCSSLNEIVLNDWDGHPYQHANNAFDDTNDCPIKVDCALVFPYQNVWPEYASRFVGYNCNDLKAIMYGGAQLDQYRTIFNDGNGIIGVADIEGAHGDERPDLETYAIVLPTVSIIDEECFRPAWNLSAVTIPDTLTEVRERAFYETKIRTITLPSGMTSIGDSAFEGCTALTGVTIKATTPPTLGEDAFRNTNDCPILVPCDHIVDYQSDYDWYPYGGRIDGYDCPPTKARIIFNDGPDDIYIQNFDPTLTRQEVTDALAGLSGLYWGCWMTTAVTAVGDGALSGFGEYLFAVAFDSETPPTLGNDPLDSNATYPIYVPETKVDVYKAAWPQYASRIEALIR